MNIETSLLLEIFRDITLPKEACNLIAAEFEKINLKKGNTLLHADEVVHNQYYVYDGCLRTFFIDQSGKEHTLQFAIKDWWISDYTAFFTASKAVMTIECIQDATVYKVSRSSLEGLYDDIPKLETFYRKKMEKAFAAFQHRILSGLSLTAKERYTSFISTYPTIEQSVKNYHIASYLGITTESLSRIRKEISQ
jgi:CRP-like cAMP-binding protein